MKPKSVMSCELWSINKWLRWTGFRLYIEVDARVGEVAHFTKPTRVGIQFWGWSFLK